MFPFLKSSNMPHNDVDNNTKKFVNTISSGSLLNTGTMLLSIFLVWHNLDKAIDKIIAKQQQNYEELTKVTKQNSENIDFLYKTYVYPKRNP